MVDACLPPQLAEDLRRKNINAVWVPAIIGDGVSDDEIERQLLIGEGPIWESRKKNKVLLTRDVKFFRKLRKKGHTCQISRRSWKTSCRLQRIEDVAKV